MIIFFIIYLFIHLNFSKFILIFLLIKIKYLYFILITDYYYDFKFILINY